MRGMLRFLGPAEAVIATMAVVAASSLFGVFSGWQFFPVVVAGVVVALFTYLAAGRFKLHLAEWLAVNIAGFAIVGAVVTRGIPLPAAYAAFFRGLTDGWADVLSSVPPTILSAEYRVVPYALAWLAATAGLGILKTIRVPGAAALGPLAALGLGLLFAVETRSVSLLQGGLLVGLALGLGVFQQRDLGFEVDQSIGNTTVIQRRRRLLGASAVLLAIVGIAPVAASFVPGFDERDRFDLRDRLEPPWEPLNEASPLAELKANYDDSVREDVLFTVTADAIPDRFALATLAHYDGRVWTVGSSELSGSAPFGPLDQVAPAVPSPYATDLQELTIETSGLGGVWFPLAGQLIAIVDRQGESPGAMRFNRLTGTLAIPDGVLGERLTVSVRPAPVLSVDELASLSVLPASPIEVQGQTSVIRSRSADMVEGAAQGWPQVEAIKEQLISNGSYSVDERNQPGHSWARLTTFFAEDQWFGNEEQYAAVAGIVARNSGLPARVVVGYRLDDNDVRSGSVSVVRDDAAAWIEVDTVEHGWIAVDVTPDRDKEPDFSDPGVRTEAVAAPNPPPPPPPPPDIEAERPEEDEDEEDEEEEEEVIADEGIPTLALVAAGSVGVPLGLLALWIAVFAAIKAFIRRRRRGAGDLATRTANAWREATDRLAEFGVTASKKLSVNEQARQMETLTPAATGLVGLASAADRATFGGGEIPEDLADTAWSGYDSIRESVRSEASLARRMRHLADPRPVVKRGRS